MIDKVSTSMRTIVFATNNEHKLQELRAILGASYRVVSLAEIGCHDRLPETATTIEGNARQKAQYVYNHYGVDCFADDTALEVRALDGQPGVYTARYGLLNGYGDDHDAQGNTRCLLSKMQGIADRTARFRTVVALVWHGTEHLFEGVVDGVITLSPHGTQGFGYDPVFRPIGHDSTFAEMPAREKNAISHRARAVALLAAFLFHATEDDK